jgi:hypothetical protein
MPSMVGAPMIARRIPTWSRWLRRMPRRSERLHRCFVAPNRNTMVWGIGTRNSFVLTMSARTNPGQTAGVYVPVEQDDRFPEFFYSNPLPDGSGTTPQVPASFPATNVEGCCWWGRDVIQSTGRCNFGKLNKYVGAGAGENALYPEISFCQLIRHSRKRRGFRSQRVAQAVAGRS